MKILKALGIWLACEFFCLFISLTLAGSSSTFMRIICSVCTVGILIVIVFNLAVKEAEKGIKSERVSGRKNSAPMNISAGFSLSAPSAVSWILLYISASGRSFDFYRWHKLINAPFLQIYNLINSNASSAALKISEVWMMFPLIFIHSAVYFTAYFLTFNGIIFTDNTKK